MSALAAPSKEASASSAAKVVSFRKDGFRKGDRKVGGAPPPRDRNDLRCINCGGKGHTYRESREKELPRDQRPCLNCGKPGHISRDCKQPRAVLLDGGADRQQQSRHFNLDGDSEARVCAAETQMSKTHTGRKVLISLALMGSGRWSMALGLGCPSGTCPSVVRR